MKKKKKKTKKIQQEKQKTMFNIFFHFLWEEMRGGEGKGEIKLFCMPEYQNVQH